MTLIADKTGMLAAETAADLFAANIERLGRSQPIAESAISTLTAPRMDWLFGRDGALTARDEQGRWLADTSLPRRVAEAQLKQLDLQGAVACFLAPSHAAAIQVALAHTAVGQAIIAIVPSPDDLADALHCVDFTRAMDEDKLWFVTGDSWADDLAELFRVERGLSIPTQFIRLNTLDSAVAEKLIADAQRVFSNATVERSHLAESLSNNWRPTSRKRLCVIAPTSFRLWNDFGSQLRTALGDDSDIEFLDSENVRSTSTLAIIELATRCDALVTINFGRADSARILPDDLAWICWCTNGRIPSPVATSPRDRLLILDETDRLRAIDAGWCDDAIVLATPPVASLPLATSADALTIIADTCSFEVPKALDAFSSQVPLWETLAAEIEANPLSLVGRDIGKLLDERAAQFNVPASTLNLPLFIDRLIVPAYQHGLLKLVLKAGIRTSIFGAGWDAIAEAKPFVRGTVSDRISFDRALIGSRNLLHVYPTTRAHPIDFSGRTVVRPGKEFLRQIREEASEVRVTQLSNRVISAALLREIID